MNSQIDERKIVTGAEVEEKRTEGVVTTTAAVIFTSQRADSSNVTFTHEKQGCWSKTRRIGCTVEMNYVWKNNDLQDEGVLSQTKHKRKESQLLSHLTFDLVLLETTGKTAFPTKVDLRKYIKITTAQTGVTLRFSQN